MEIPRRECVLLHVCVGSAEITIARRNLRLKYTPTVLYQKSIVRRFNFNIFRLSGDFFLLFLDMFASLLSS